MHLFEYKSQFMSLICNPTVQLLISVYLAHPMHSLFVNLSWRVNLPVEPQYKVWMKMLRLEESAEKNFSWVLNSHQFSCQLLEQEAEIVGAGLWFGFWKMPGLGACLYKSYKYFLNSTILRKKLLQIPLLWSINMNLFFLLVKLWNALKVLKYNTNKILWK